MKRRNILVALGVSALFAASQAHTQQQRRVPRIGWLSITDGHSPRHDAFRQALRELGYVEGQTIAIEPGFAQFREERLPGLAAELVRLNVDVIVALEPVAIYAARNATKTIPIVIRSTDDPVKMGVIASLARPGGNITGVTSMSTELSGKRIEVLREILPRFHILGVLLDPSDSEKALKWKELEAAAHSLGLTLRTLEARTADDFASAFQAAAKERVQALITLRSPLIVNNGRRIAELAMKARLPAIYDDESYVEEGGLVSYGASLRAAFRLAAVYVDKILKGAKPAELPVEQLAKFELVINLKTAKALGLKIPPSILLQADRVIE